LVNSPEFLMPIVPRAGFPPATLHTLTRLAFAVLRIFAGAVQAQQWRNTPVPVPQDPPYPGTIALHVDASSTAQGIIRVREIIPVTAGRLSLLYLQWIPGSH
jgi:hypothetical protein